MAQLQAIVASDGARFIRQSKLVQNRVHEVAGAVAGKRPAGSVSAMRSRSKSKDENAGPGIAKTWYGTGPVSLIQIGAAFGLTDPAAVVSQPGAALAGADGVVNLPEELGRILCGRGCHSIP